MSRGIHNGYFDRFGDLNAPLFRLLAINLAGGMAAAALLVGGLLLLNPAGLRDLIFADSDPAAALGLLLFGFVITFGSTAMGSAIMAMGERGDDGGPGQPPGQSAGRLVVQRSNNSSTTK